jgi:type II secretory pathway pseudopilin PulG
MKLCLFAPVCPANGFTPHSPAWRSSEGFTLLEIVLVLFLLVGMLGLVIPRMSLGEDLGTVGRRWVGAMKSFQEMAMLRQKTVRVYVDIDRSTYWPMVIDANEEKIPLDPTWAMPIVLPDTVRFADIQVGSTIKQTGRVDIFFYPNGRIDQAIVHLTDMNNNIMGVFVEPVTGMIRITDHRIDPPKPITILERVRPLLQPVTAGIRPALPSGLPPSGLPPSGFPSAVPPSVSK